MTTTKEQRTYEFPLLAFSSAAEFEAFLEREHKSAPGIYLKLAYKSSGIPSVSAAEALEVALCYGWINGRGNSYDDKQYLARYTPRRAKSTWSQINVNLVAKLLQEGRMRPAGIAEVERAKADGRWERAYASPTTIAVPEDLTSALAAEPAAAAFFEGLNKGDRYLVLIRLEMGSPKGRTKRIETLVRNLAEGKGPAGGTSAKPAAKSRVESEVKSASTGRAASKEATRRKRSSATRDTPAGEETHYVPRRAGLRSRR